MQKYPNILAIDIGEILRQVQGIMERVSRAVEFVFLFTLAGGLLVLQAAIASTQDERKFDAAILRTLGASQRQLRSAQIAEFLLLGRARGPASRAAGATAIGWALADRVFKFRFAGNPLRVAVRHRRRRGRGHARRLARHAVDGARAAARRCCANSAEGFRTGSASAVDLDDMALSRPAVLRRSRRCKNCL